MAEKKTSFEVIHPPNKLKELVGSAGKMDDSLLEKAEGALKVYADSVDLSETCKDQMNTLQDSLDAVTAAGTLDDAYHKIIYGVMHDLRGQGASFNYPLVTRIATSMNHYLDHAEGTRGQHEVDVVQAHVDALRAVLSNKLRGETGAIGEQIAGGLEEISGIKAARS